MNLLPQEDEGTPLMCPSFTDGQYRLVGSLLSAPNCGADTESGLVYTTTLADSYDWIMNTLKEYSYDVPRQGGRNLDNQLNKVELPGIRVSETIAQEEASISSTETTLVRSIKFQNTIGNAFVESSKCTGYQIVHNDSVSIFFRLVV